MRDHNTAVDMRENISLSVRDLVIFNDPSYVVDLDDLQRIG